MADPLDSYAEGPLGCCDDVAALPILSRRSAMIAARSHVSAICRKMRCSRSLRAALAQPMDSSANSRHSFEDDMARLPFLRAACPFIAAQASKNLERPQDFARPGASCSYALMFLDLQGLEGHKVGRQKIAFDINILQNCIDGMRF
jgi:hypothetical protein